MVRQVHETSNLELVEFCIRKINRNNDEHSFTYDSFLSYIELVENLLAFDISPGARLKLANKITKYLLPIVINALFHNPSDKVI